MRLRQSGSREYLPGFGQGTPCHGAPPVSVALFARCGKGFLRTCRKNSRAAPAREQRASIAGERQQQGVAARCTLYTVPHPHPVSVKKHLVFSGLRQEFRSKFLIQTSYLQIVDVKGVRPLFSVCEGMICLPNPPREPLIKLECDPGIPSGAKARLHFVALTARLNRLRKNPKGMAKPERNLPSGAKALFILLALSARLKPCPFKTTAEASFSATCEVVPFQSIDLFRGSQNKALSFRACLCAAS